MPDLANLVASLQGAVSVDDVVNLLASAIMVGVPFVLGWFAVRKTFSVFQSAVRKGRARV